MLLLQKTRQAFHHREETIFPKSISQLQILVEITTKFVNIWDESFKRFDVLRLQHNLHIRLVWMKTSPERFRCWSITDRWLKVCFRKCGRGNPCSSSNSQLSRVQSNNFFLWCFLRIQCIRSNSIIEIYLLRSSASQSKPASRAELRFYWNCSGYSSNRFWKYRLRRVENHQSICEWARQSIRRVGRMSSWAILPISVLGWIWIGMYKWFIQRWDGGFPAGSFSKTSNRTASHSSSEYWTSIQLHLSGAVV